MVSRFVGKLSGKLSNTLPRVNFESKASIEPKASVAPTSTSIDALVNSKSKFETGMNYITAVLNLGTVYALVKSNYDTQHQAGSKQSQVTSQHSEAHSQHDQVIAQHKAVVEQHKKVVEQRERVKAQRELGLAKQRQGTFVVTYPNIFSTNKKSFGHGTSSEIEVLNLLNN